MRRCWGAVAMTVAAAAVASASAGASPHDACARGAGTCVGAVVDEMDSRLEPLAASCDHKAAFAFMYREVTDTVARAEPGFFRSAASLDRLDVVFASFYFDAFDTWRHGRRANVPEAWRIAFAAADERRVQGIGDMLLGMNAHISRDLPFALERLRRAGRTVAKGDFDRVNVLLVRVQGPMLKEAARRFDPGVDDFSVPVLDVDDQTVGQLLAAWREEAWLNARRLASASTTARRKAVAQTIEQSAALRALAIRAATSYLPFVSSTTPRDAWCRSQRR